MIDNGYCDQNNYWNKNNQ